MTQQKTLSDYTLTDYILWCAIGFGFWLLGVIVIRTLGSNVFQEGNAILILLYLFSIPNGFITVYICRAIARIPMQQMLLPLTVMNVAALLLDGIGVAAGAYGNDHEVVRYGAAWLLWTFGLVLLVGLWLSSRKAGN